MKPVELFHIGPQKSGTTWLYRCLREHPEVACPPKDSIHYFDMFYAKGREWYASHFVGAGPDQHLFDPTPSTLRSPWAARRIHEENPQARIALTLRNPVERAFSHYWHEKKKQRFEFRFDELLNNYDLFSSWLEPGFYAEPIERFLRYFPKEQILWQRFEGIAAEPEAFFDDFCAFAGVATGLRPEVLHRKVNAAGERHDFLSQRVKPKLQAAVRRVRAISGAADPSTESALLSGKAEYARGIPQEFLQPLWEICEPEVARLEALTGLDLTDWRR